MVHMLFVYSFCILELDRVVGPLYTTAKGRDHATPRVLYIEGLTLKN